MIRRKFCILKKKWTFVAFHYLTLLVRCEEIGAYINYLYLFLKSRYCEYILENNFFDIWDGADFGPYSSQSFLHAEWIYFCAISRLDANLLYT
jgi:hypothetical protein